MYEASKWNLLPRLQWITSYIHILNSIYNLFMFVILLIRLKIATKFYISYLTGSEKNRGHNIGIHNWWNCSINLYIPSGIFYEEKVL